MLRQCCASAVSTISSARIRKPSVAGPSRAESWEICQFWQKEHLKLQPMTATEKEAVPGRKW